MTRKATHFSSSHPLADIAAEHCQKHMGPRDLGLSGIACGQCWELAIRDDEKFVVENELPRELETDPDYIDDVAVRQTLEGQKVPLTRAERAEVTRRQAAHKLARLAPAIPTLRVAA